MPSGPSKKLENLAGLLIPPACREEVLGDLHERYTSPARYLTDAITTAPFVLFGRIRRVTDPQVFLLEALLIYASFVVVAWYQDRALLAGQSGLLRLAVPAAITLVLALFEAAWAPGRVAPYAVLLAGPLLCSFCLRSVLPWQVGLYGFYTGGMLDSAVRWLFQSRPDRPQAASLHIGNRPAVLPREMKSFAGDAKSFLALGAAVALLAIVLAPRPEKAVAALVPILVIWLSISGFGKE
jgi:hypothetical protein